MPALNDSATTLAELKTRVLAFVRERDWEQFHDPRNLALALMLEAAELKKLLDPAALTEGGVRAGGGTGG